MTVLSRTVHENQDILRTSDVLRNSDWTSVVDVLDFKETVNHFFNKPFLSCNIIRVCLAENVTKKNNYLSGINVLLAQYPPLGS